MAINKVIYNNNTLIDLTSDTAVESDVALGKTFHKADGSSAVGTGSGGTECDLYVGDDTGIQTGDLFIDDVGGEPVLQDKSVTITANGSQNVTADSGYDGLGTVAITTNIQPSLQSKSATYTSNGSYTVTADSGYYGLSSTNITVDVSGGGGATEPYIEETHNSSGYCIGMKFYGFNNEDVGGRRYLTTIDWNNCTPKSIASYAFYDCVALASLSLPSSVTSIGYNAFFDCANLTSLTIPNSVTFIDAYAFASCTRLVSLTLPNAITSISSNAFRNCYSLISLTIPSSVTTISDYSFYGCKALTSLTIPSSVTTINGSAFAMLGSNKSAAIVTFKGTPTTIASNTFYQASKITHIYVPWSSGAVANAPWGATNATVHYNCVT